MKLADLRRLWQIQRVVRRYGLTEFLPGHEPTRAARRDTRLRGERLRQAL